MNEPEDTNVVYQTYKLSRLATILSLDSVQPLFPFIEVPTSAPEAYKTAMREAILRNRKAFDADTTKIPELNASIEDALDIYFGQAAIQKFRYWKKNIFVVGPGDYRAFSAYQGLLLGAKNADDEWNALHLPSRLSDTARRKFSLMIDSTEPSDLDDIMRETELSQWDLDMYSRHGLNEEFKDPWITINLTYTQLRYRQFMGWLLPQLNETEVAAFYHASEREAKAHNLLYQGKTMPHPRTQILPDPALD